MKYLDPDALRTYRKSQGDALYAIRRDAYARFSTDNLGCEHVMHGTLQNDYMRNPGGTAYFMPDEGCQSHGPANYADSFWLVKNFLFADTEREAAELLIQRADSEIAKLTERLGRLKSIQQMYGNKTLKLGAGTALLGCQGKLPDDPDCYDMMNFEDFKSACESGCITGDDGVGDLLVAGILYPECRVDPDGKGIWTPKNVWISFSEIPAAFNNKDVSIAWYNK